MLRRVLWLLAGLAAIVAAGTWFIHSTDPINPATFERIQVGMTLEEVETVIGKPPGFYYTGTPDRKHRRFMLGFDPSGEPKDWTGNNYEITVWIDHEGKVARSSIDKMTAANPSIADRVRAWLAGW